jgi:hypothetical protein
LEVAELFAAGVKSRAEVCTMALKIQAPKDARPERFSVTVPADLCEKLMLYCELIGIPKKRAGYVLVEGFAQFLTRDREFQAAWNAHAAGNGTSKPATNSR